MKGIFLTNTLLNNGQPFEVKGFIRELPKNCYPSAEKRAQAAALGIILGEHQTLVDSYMKNNNRTSQAELALQQALFLFVRGIPAAAPAYWQAG